MSSPVPRPPPEVTRSLFDEAYGEIYGIPYERFEVEVLSPLPTDVVRLFFELADEAILNPARDNPFAEEKRVFELSSETLAQELVRLQKLGEAALLAFNKPGGQQGPGQLPGMLATMYVGATRVKPAARGARLKAGLADGLPIAFFSFVLALFVSWFTAPSMRAGLLAFEGPALIAIFGLIMSLALPIAVLYYLRAGRSWGYRKQFLEVVNAKSGNPVSSKTARSRAWLVPLSIPSAALLGSSRWLSDRATGSTVRRNYALKRSIR